MIALFLLISAATIELQPDWFPLMNNDLSLDEQRQELDDAKSHQSSGADLIFLTSLAEDLYRECGEKLAGELGGAELSPDDAAEAALRNCSRDRVALDFWAGRLNAAFPETPMASLSDRVARVRAHIANGIAISHPKNKASPDNARPGVLSSRDRPSDK